MEKKFLITALLILFALPSFSELTLEDTVNPEYMRNNGYSTATINATRKVVAQSNGEPLAEPVENKLYENPAVKFVRRVFMYIDPSLDDHTFMNDHDIRTSPRFDDL